MVSTKCLLVNVLAFDKQGFGFAKSFLLLENSCQRNCHTRVRVVLITKRHVQDLYSLRLICFRFGVVALLLIYLCQASASRSVVSISLLLFGIVQQSYLFIQLAGPRISMTPAIHAPIVTS